MTTTAQDKRTQPKLDTLDDYLAWVETLAAVEPKLGPTLGHPPVKLFGWDGGHIRARGFEVIE